MSTVAASKITKHRSEGLAVVPDLKDIQRFFQKVTPAPKRCGCWLWLGAADEKGTTQFWYNGRVVGANRYAYCLLSGLPLLANVQLKRIPECKYDNCINPAHMEVKD